MTRQKMRYSRPESSKAVIKHMIETVLPDHTRWLEKWHGNNYLLEDLSDPWEHRQPPRFGIEKATKFDLCGACHRAMYDLGLADNSSEYYDVSGAIIAACDADWDKFNYEIAKGFEDIHRVLYAAIKIIDEDTDYWLGQGWQKTEDGWKPPARTNEVVAPQYDAAGLEEETQND